MSEVKRRRRRNSEHNANSRATKFPLLVLNDGHRETPTRLGGGDGQISRQPLADASQA